jgi:membrane-associated phospholipid phosphatase
MATVLAEYQPKCKWLAYGVASTIGWSRIETDAHHWQDVVAGAALGYYVALHFAD